MFVRSANPIWWIPDHIGLPLNDEYYAFFLTNTLPYLPQNVYRDPQGQTVWTGNVIEFSPAGTLPENLYFDPALVYRIEIRHGDTQFDELIWEVNNFVPCCAGAEVITENPFFGAENQISNPQFSEINFISPITITSPGTYAIAPGWDLVLTGGGVTSIVSQNILQGNDQIVGNPPYSLRINNNGWTTALLRQRLENNGALWADGAISMSVTALAEVSPQGISLAYQPSTGPVVPLVASGTIGVGAYEVLAGVINLPASTNTDTSATAYVDAIINIPPTGIINVTNVQLLGQADQLIDPTIVVAPAYQQETNERVVDHLFHYYKDPLLRKPIPSYLVGWDFPLNPAQRGTGFSSAAGANTSFYSWDQTIIYQSVSNSMSTSRTTGQFLSVTANTAGQMALIQYLPGQVAIDFLGNPINPISVYFDATSLAAGPVVQDITCTISLWATSDASLPSMAANQSIVATLDTNGKPATFNGTWTEITPLNGQNATFTLGTGEHFFDGYWNNSSILASNPTFFAIVIGFATVPITNSLVFKRIALQRGAVATPPGAQTQDDVLRECQYYYEQSYEIGTAVATVTTTGQRQTPASILIDIGGSADTLFISSFPLVYNTVKRIAPNVQFYSPSGATGTIRAAIKRDNAFVTVAVPSNPLNITFSTNYTTLAASTSSIDFACTNTSSAFITTNTSALGDEAILFYHYSADARLGIV